MKTRRLVAFLVLATLAATVNAAPPATPRPSKKPSPTPPAPAPAETAAANPPSLLRWLVQQDGGPDAAVLPLADLVLVTTGKRIAALDPANAADAALVARLGAALDLVLPRLNRPDGRIRAAPLLTSQELAARVAEELSAALGTDPGLTLENLNDATLPDAPYPGLRLTDKATGRACYLAVAAYPSDGREAGARALTLRPTEAAARIKADGNCLLVGIEHNGKAGRDAALLDWQLIDLARITVRCAVGFDADQHAVHLPNATLADGRRGRD